MAIHTVTITIENTTEDVAKCPINDTGSSLIGIIAPGMIDVVLAAGGGTTNWYSRTSTLFVPAGYRRLMNANGNTSTTFNASCDPGITSCETVIEEFCTRAGDLDGVVCENATTTFRFRAAANVIIDIDHAEVRLKAYHRTSDAAGGAETLLGEIDQTINTTMTTYTGNMTLSKSWLTDERLVVKFYAYFLAIQV